MIRSVSYTPSGILLYTTYIMYIKKKQIKEKIISIHFQITKKILRATESNPEAYVTRVNLERGNVREERKRKKRSLHDKFIWNGFFAYPPSQRVYVWRSEPPATPILKQQILAVSSGETRGRVYIRTSAPRPDPEKSTDINSRPLIKITVTSS